MAAAADAIWAIDLGNNSLKALHLIAVGDVVQVIGFDHIPHGKILSSAGVNAAEKEELVAITLREFVQRNDIGFDPIIISVPSQNSFARFVTLPPVEAKRIPEIVRFEAAQQIPFDMNEIQWDWQLMSAPDSPEKKVGLFAIKNEVVNAAMEYFEREDLQINYVQMAPMALYNFLLFDRPDLVSSEKRAAVVVNVGADSTDLVVCTASGVWQRCIMMGGNAFTSAIAETFKLSFEKAEKLKRTAPVSKYARQIFQAMRPVFTDWAGEVQRSLGFYTSSNPDVKLTKVVAMGGGTKLRGLLKYLQQTIQVPVEKPDAFKRLAVAQGVSTAKFHESVGDFGVVYGLGLQGLGMARIESNLLPKSVARSMAWAGKTRYFVGAAVMLLTVSLMCLGRIGWDRITYAKAEGTRSLIKRAIADTKGTIQKTSGLTDEESAYRERMRKQFEWFRYREVVPQLHEIIVSALPNAKTNPEQKRLYEAFAQGDAAAVKQIPRPERKQLFLTNVSVYFSDDLANAKFGKTAMTRKDTMMTAQTETSEGYDTEMLRELEQIYGAEYMKNFNMGGAAQQQKDPGFVITVVGYSPYKNIGELLDPPNVRDKPARWGFVTRLENLHKFVGANFADGNCPFELYDRAADHFKLEKAPVDLDTDVPLGIGEIQFIPDPTAKGTTSTGPSTAMIGPGMMNTVPILIDPMTDELISSELQTDSSGKPIWNAMGKEVKKDHDYWFQLDFKLLWKKAPVSTASTGSAGGMGTAPAGK